MPVPVVPILAILDATDTAYREPVTPGVAFSSPVACQDDTGHGITSAEFQALQAVTEAALLMAATRLAFARVALTLPGSPLFGTGLDVAGGADHG